MCVILVRLSRSCNVCHLTFSCPPPVVLCRGHEGQYEVSPGKFVPQLRSVSSDLRRLSASSVVREEVTPAPLLNEKMDQGIVITHPCRQIHTDPHMNTCVLCPHPTQDHYCVLELSASTLP
jgi:hypothetical protein